MRRIRGREAQGCRSLGNGRLGDGEAPGGGGMAMGRLADETLSLWGWRGLEIERLNQLEV